MAVRRVLQTVSWASLLVVIGAPMLFLGGQISLDQTKAWMLAGTVGWFLVTPLWMERKSGPAGAGSQEPGG